MLNDENVLIHLQNSVVSGPVFQELLEALLCEAQENGFGDIEAEYQAGKERLDSVLTYEQKETLAKLEDYCAEAAKVGLWIAFQQGLYAGFQHFFQREAEPLTFEALVLNKLLTVPEVMRFPQYDHARMQVNELEAELSEPLDPFSREHLTSITYAWEEREFGLLRHGYSLGHKAAIELIQGVVPEQYTKLIESGWKVAQETNVLPSRTDYP